MDNEKYGQAKEYATQKYNQAKEYAKKNFTQDKLKEKYEQAKKTVKTRKNKEFTIKALEDVKQNMSKIMKEGLPIHLLPTIPMPPQKMLLDAAITATAVFNQLKDYVDSHKGKIVEMLNNELETKMAYSEYKKVKEQNQLEVEKQKRVQIDQNGGATFSREECEFF